MWWQDTTQYMIFAARCRNVINMIDQQALQHQLFQIRELQEVSDADRNARLRI